MNGIIPFSAACERNKEPILEVISPFLREAKSILEIGTGTAQHAMHFAAVFSQVVWQTSDQRQFIAGIESQLSHHRNPNIRNPMVIDVTHRPWVPDGTRYDLIYTANTLHIMDRAAVRSFFAGLPDVCKRGAFTIIYGPFNYGGLFTSESNRVFDLSLRSRNCGSAIRDFEWVNELAQKAGLLFIDDVKMPANNRCLIYQYTDQAD